MERKSLLDYENPGKALITGASSGIGASFARHLASQGFDLVLLARRRNRLEELADRLHSEYLVHCDIIQADISDIGEIGRIAGCIRQIENLDVLVNSAGFGTWGSFAHVPVDKSVGMLNVHVTAPVQFTYAALQIMLQRNRGTIINVSSMGAFVATSGNAVYGATKSFLNSFSENLELELGGTGVQIQALCPGFVMTEFHDAAELAAFDRNAVPGSMWMKPDDVVSSSLEALKRNKKIVYIPGRKNNLFLWIFQHSAHFRALVQNSAQHGA